MSTQISLTSGGVVSVACGPGSTVRLDVSCFAPPGVQCFVDLPPAEAARVGAELLRRSGAVAWQAPPDDEPEDGLFEAGV